MWDALETRARRARELEQRLADPAVLANSALYQRYAKERAALAPFIELYEQYRDVQGKLAQAREILEHPDSDQELRREAEAEKAAQGARLEILREELEPLFIEDDPEGLRNAIVEIRAGTGGLEASLFATDLYRMYTRYAAARGWTVELLSSSASEAGGFKEIIFGVSGAGVYRELQFERGVHRVQRVPVTESSGRIHTSTVTVAVLPEAEEVDEVPVHDKDLRVDTY
ncbi:MAG: PCRF domain-containing protein, partial [Candidatus Omnitrophica bacterium]|nr:PCRF domain-containing protein [Candidatus Omnitrophota bacterium]